MSKGLNIFLNLNKLKNILLAEVKMKKSESKNKKLEGVRGYINNVFLKKV